jgi:hypothetical protein
MVRFMTGTVRRHAKEFKRTWLAAVAKLASFIAADISEYNTATTHVTQ